MLFSRPAALWLLALAGARIAAGSGLDELLDRLEQTSRTQAPLAHIDTLLSAAELLPNSERRLELLQSAVSLLGGVANEDARYFYWSAAAHLLAAQDFGEAEQLCLRIPARQSAAWRADYRGRCWQFLAQRAAQRASDRRTVVLRGLQAGAFHIPAAVELIAGDPAEGAEILQAMITAYPARLATVEDFALLDKASRLVAPFNLGLAREAAIRLRQSPAPRAPKADDEPAATAGPERAEELFSYADDLSLPPGERSTRLLKALDATPRMKNTGRRLQLQAYLTAWFTAEGATGTATKAAELLHTTLEQFCPDEKTLPEIDGLVDFLAENRIDPENLRVRHPALGARLLLRELRERTAR
jgi:hypothetical protein